MPSIPKGVDWELFGECCRNLCAGKVKELQRLVPMHKQTAKKVLRNGSCGVNTFYRLCKYMHLSPKVFQKEFGKSCQQQTQ